MAIYHDSQTQIWPEEFDTFKARVSSGADGRHWVNLKSGECSLPFSELLIVGATREEADTIASAINATDERMMPEAATEQAAQLEAAE